MGIEQYALTRSILNAGSEFDHVPVEVGDVCILEARCVLPALNEPTSGGQHLLDRGGGLTGLVAVVTGATALVARP